MITDLVFYIGTTTLIWINFWSLFSTTGRMEAQLDRIEKLLKNKDEE